MADEVLSEVRGRILLITLNRPTARNAIDTALAQGLLAAVERLDEDKGLTAAVLTGAGRGFCSGMDLKAFAQDGFPRGFEQVLVRESAKPLIPPEACAASVIESAPASRMTSITATTMPWLVALSARRITSLRSRSSRAALRAVASCSLVTISSLKEITPTVSRKTVRSFCSCVAVELEVGSSSLSPAVSRNVVETAKKITSRNTTSTKGAMLISTSERRGL